MTPDLINGLVFELLGSLMICVNIYRILVDRRSRGVSIWSVLFFTLWGYWNLYFYSQLGQFWSLLGGLCMVASNTVWVALLFHFWRKEVRGRKMAVINYRRVYGQI